VAVTTAYTESTLHNDTTQADHDSEGLSSSGCGTTSRRGRDPVKATNAFLDRLVTVSKLAEHRVGVDAQAVQHSKYPGKYQPNAPLAAAIVGQFWPTASGAAGPRRPHPPRRSPRHRPGRARTPAGGPAARRAESRARRRPPRHWAASRGVPRRRWRGERWRGRRQIVGPTGNNIAGTTLIPAGFIISGSQRAYTAVKYALNQLGKPYVFGAAGPDSFDCSGLTMAAWAAAGSRCPTWPPTKPRSAPRNPPTFPRRSAGIS